VWHVGLSDLCDLRVVKLRALRIPCDRDKISALS